MNSEHKEPPLGIKPRWLHAEHRLRDLRAAMNRYRQAFAQIPDEWVDEEIDLCAWLSKNRPKQKT